MQEKAQAALEYLMTYGWALIIIVVAASVLFFVMSTPSPQVSFSSSDPAKILLKTGNIGSSGNVEVKAQNATGQQISVTGFALSGDFAGSKLNGIARGSISTATPVAIPSGGEMVFSEITYAGTGKVDGTIEINYTDGFGYVKSARITAKGQTSSTATALSGPTNITVPGTYVLSSDFSCTGNCITISTSNVVLNGNGKTLTGNGSGNGITINNASSVTINSVKTRSFSYGIYSNKATNSSFSGNDVRNSSTKGFYFSQTSTGNSFGTNIACCNSQDIFCENFTNIILNGTGNIANAVGGCLASTSGCAAAGIIC